MNKRPLRSLAWGCGLAVTVYVAASCGAESLSKSESNTNWLKPCVQDGECGDALSCACGVCTATCDADSHCGEWDVHTRCEELAASCGDTTSPSSSACLAQCTDDAQCADIGGAVCRRGVCARTARTSCPTFPAGTRSPTVVHSSFEPIEGISQMHGVAVIDGSRIYWFDWDGALYASPLDGSASPQMLRPAPARPAPASTRLEILGMIADDTTLYWGEADRDIELPNVGPPSPPGRLYAVAKAGGEPILLREDTDQLLIPLAAMDDRVLVRHGHGHGLRTVATDGSGASELVASQVPSESARVIKGKLYWTEWAEDPSEETDFYDLWRADIDGNNAAQVTRIEGSEFLVSGNLVLWRQERVHIDPLVLDHNYVMLDEVTGCTQPLPAVGESISHTSVADGRHVYWHSYNGLSSDLGAVMPLIRVDLRTGGIEQILTPGFEAVVSNHIVAQTETHLYVLADGALGSIAKP